jgi:HK97 family phage prohead protease
MSNSIVRKRIQPDTKNVGFVSKDDTELLRVPVSSTSEDRDGDMFSQDGLNRQLEQLENGAVKMFPDHGLDDMGHPVYRFTDIMGKWVGGEIEDNTLYGLAELREGDSNAEELRDLVEQGMPVGFSVGFGVKEDSATETENGREFDDADLMEVSPVGIESNPDAVIGAAVAKAVGESENPQDAIADLTTAIKNMSDEEQSDPPEEEGKDTGEEQAQKEDDYEDEDEEDKQMDSEMVDEVFNAVSEAFSNALEEARNDLVDGENANDEEEEEEEDEEMSADVKALVDTVESQEETIDELRAKVESLESKSREAGEKKGMVPAENNDTDEESKASEAPESFYEELA